MQQMDIMRGSPVFKFMHQNFDVRFQVSLSQAQGAHISYLEDHLEF